MHAFLVLVAVAAFLFGALGALASLEAQTFPYGLGALVLLFVFLGKRARPRPASQLVAGLAYWAGFAPTWASLLADAHARCSPPNCSMPMSPIEEMLWGVGFAVAPVALLALFTYHEMRVP